MSGLDWASLLRVGVQGLGLKPCEFWRLTPAELRLMLGDTAPAAMGRARLDEMLAAFPDVTARKSQPESHRR
ncbi:rcc01693 family protein [Pseudooceanicola sp. MF1-13]|uniref:rcc01693 family protein n=1 Tax=Pseudooceanicola sp. MF1-13 TaxID=3379095 RepID=UPI003892454C